MLPAIFTDVSSISHSPTPRIAAGELPKGWSVVSNLRARSYRSDNHELSIGLGMRNRGIKSGVTLVNPSVAESATHRCQKFAFERGT